MNTLRIGRKVNQPIHVFDGDKEITIVTVIDIKPDADQVEIKVDWGDMAVTKMFFSDLVFNSFVLRDAANEPTITVKVSRIYNNQVTLLFHVPRHIKVLRAEKLS